MSWNLASKNPPQKRNMRFGSYWHVVSPTNLKKIRFCCPREKNHKTSLSKWNHWIDKTFSIINEKKLYSKFCSSYPLWIIKKNFAQFWTNEFWAKIGKIGKKHFISKLADIFFLLFKVGMGNKFFQLSLKQDLNP